jgi:hypothetical protein
MAALPHPMPVGLPSDFVPRVAWPYDRAGLSRRLALELRRTGAEQQEDARRALLDQVNLLAWQCVLVSPGPLPQFHVTLSQEQVATAVAAGRMAAWDCLPALEGAYLAALCCGLLDGDVEPSATSLRAMRAIVVDTSRSFAADRAAAERAIRDAVFPMLFDFTPRAELQRVARAENERRGLPLLYDEIEALLERAVMDFITKHVAVPHARRRG